MIETRTSRLALIALCLFAAAVIFDMQISSEARADDEQDSAIGLAVASSTLYSAREDLRLWRELENQNIDNEAVKQIIANNLIRHVLTVGAAKIDVREIKGSPLEALCLLTTDEVKGILGQSDHKEMSKMAIHFIESIEHEVIGHVREIQKSLHGTGCNLSPGEPHF